MRKVGIIVLIILLIIMIAGLSKVLMFAINHNDWNWFMHFGSSENVRKEEYIRKQEKIEISDISKLKLEFKSSDLNVFFTEESDIRVVQYSYKELREDQLFSVDRTSSSVEISENRKPQFFIFYIGFMEQIAYDVYIPKTYEKDLEIKSVSGDIEVNEILKFEDLTISSTSGDVKMGNVEAQNIKIETISGDIKLQDIESDNIKLKAVSGDIKALSAIGNIETKTTSGEIEFGKIDGKIDATSVSGNIKSENFKVTKDSKIKTTSGDVKMYLNEESNCEIWTKTTSGNVTLPNRRNVMGVEPYVELNIETVSGNIRLEK